MSVKYLYDQSKIYGLKKGISIIDSNPEKNIPRLIKLIKKIDSEGNIEKQMNAIDNILKEDNNWNKLIEIFGTNIDKGVRRKLLENFIINISLNGKKLRELSKEKYNCNIPWAILMDPTSSCNLKCTGCWAADYGNKLSMDFNTLDNIVNQGKKHGTFMYIFSGGEPLIRKKDIISLCRKYSDCIFLAFTNGTLIDEAFTNEILEVKNFIPAISVEGFEEATDLRRGEGTYSKVLESMELLKSKKLPFGFSSCYTSQNTKEIGSELFFDKMIDMGALFGWFFTYMPIGMDAVPELMVSPSQREFMYHKLRDYRKSKPLFTIDFWNDGEYSQGCIAGAKQYLHISANGDIEPCAFIHYSDSNVYDKTLIEAYQSPLFMQYRENQPFNENHLRPCPLLDNPSKLEEMVTHSKAKSTELLSPESVDHLCYKCKSPSEKWGKTADKLWKNSNSKKAESDDC